MPTQSKPHGARANATLALLVIFAMLLTAQLATAQQDCHGCESGNLLPNCNFDAFHGGPPQQVPDGWNPFVLSGSLTFMQDSDSLYGAPSLRMWSNGGTFVAGIFSQVGGLQPGVAYKASVGWAAPNEPDSFGRRLGIDPTGGTDPNAATVVWSPMHRGAGRRLNCPPPDPNIDVSAVAQSSTITVFVYVDHNYSTGDNYIFIDAVSLIVDPNQPAAPPPPPAPTNAPVPAPQLAAPAPTEKPTTRPPTATSSPAPSPTPAATHTGTPTPTATTTATPSNTPVPTQTDTPEPALTSTLPPRPSATAGPAPAASDGTGRSVLPAGGPQGLLWGGLGALGGAGVLGMAIASMRRR